MNNDNLRGHNRIRCEIVTTQEQLFHAYLVRAICFVDERGMATSLIYDGNDLQSTHVIVYDGKEPVGTVRIRWFKDFAEFERTCFRKAWRHPRILQACAQFAFDHVARKGFDRVVTHASPLYARMWCRLLGFSEAEGKPPIHVAGHDEPYIELVKELEPPTDVINRATDPTVVFRVEGAWDTPTEHEAA